MSTLTAFVMVPLLLTTPVTGEPVAAQAMLELRIFEADTEQAGFQVAVAGYLEGMSTFELDTALMDLEAKGNREEQGHVEIPGLGTLTGAHITSAPRIISQEGEWASIESGVQVPLVETDGREIDVLFRASLRIDTLWRWEEDGTARVETKADMSGRMLGGTFRVRDGETAYLAARDGEGWLVLMLTFRPLS